MEEKHTHSQGHSENFHRYKFGETNEVKVGSSVPIIRSLFEMHEVLHMDSGKFKASLYRAHFTSLYLGVRCDVSHFHSMILESKYHYSVQCIMALHTV